MMNAINMFTQNVKRSVSVKVNAKQIQNGRVKSSNMPAAYDTPTPFLVDNRQNKILVDHFITLPSSVWQPL